MESILFNQNSLHRLISRSISLYRLIPGSDRPIYAYIGFGSADTDRNFPIRTSFIIVPVVDFGFSSVSDREILKRTKENKGKGKKEKKERKETLKRRKVCEK